MSTEPVEFKLKLCDILLPFENLEECTKYELRTPLAEFDRLAAQQILSRVRVRI